MTFSLADSDFVFLMSVYKPIVFLLVLAGWAYIVSRFDKDLKRLFLSRQAWNGIQVGAGALAFGLWLVIPGGAMAFWIGLILALLILGGTLFGYAIYRNARIEDISQRWDLNLSAIIQQQLLDRQEAQLQKAATLHMVAKDGVVLDVPGINDPRGEPHAVLERIIDFALPRGAQGVELVAEAQQTAVAVHIDGVRYPQQALDPKLGMGLIDYLKQHAALDLADRRRRQTGQTRLKIENDDHIHTLAITTAGSTRGLSLEFDIDPAVRQQIPFDKLGLLDSQKQQLLSVLDQEAKVVIVACPAGHGQTTTLYSLVARHDPYTRNIVTLETDITFELEGVTHERLDPSVDVATFNQRLKSLMLREAAVCMLSRVSDSQTAQMVASYANQTRFYFGLRLDDTMSALRAWIKAVGDARTAADALGGIVAQRLIRRLCSTCRVPYKPDPDALRKLNLPPERVAQLYKHSGKVMVNDHEQVCPNCAGLGYRGRIAVFEIMAIDDKARSLIVADQMDQLRAYLRKQKMLWLQEAALFKAVEGVTSVSEIQRGLAKESSKAAV